MKQRKQLYISIVLALLSLLLVASYLKKREQELLDWSRPVPVLVATRDILKNSSIEEDMVTVIEAPKKFRQPGSLAHPADAIGRLTASPIMEGEQMLGTKLITFGAETGLAVKVPVGKRAISIEVDEVSGVSGLIKPDNYIDLIGTFNFGDDQKDHRQTVTLLQDIRVLAVSRDLGVGLARGTEEKGNGGIPMIGQARTTVTLALDPQQVQDVILAQHSGELHLSLRSLSETDQIYKLKPSNIQTLTGIRDKVRQRDTYEQYRGR